MSFPLPVAGQNFPTPNFPAIVLFYTRIPLGIFKVFSLELGDFSSALTFFEVFGTASPELRGFFRASTPSGILDFLLFKWFTSKFGKFLNPLTHLGIFGDYLQNWECLSPPTPSGMHGFFLWTNSFRIISSFDRWPSFVIHFFFKFIIQLIICLQIFPLPYSDTVLFGTPTLFGIYGIYYQN